MQEHRRCEKRGRRGAVMLEAAFILPLFLIFWFGIVDWGLTFFIHESVVHNATTAARWAVVNDYNVTRIKNVFLTGNPDAPGRSSPWFSLTPPQVDVQLLGSEVNNDLRVVVSVSNYQWFHFTPFFADKYYGRTITVSEPAEGLKTGL